MKSIIGITTGIFMIAQSCAQSLISNNSFEDTLATSFWTTNMGICFNSPINICNKKGSDKNIEPIKFDVVDGTNCIYLSLFQCHTGWSDYLINEGFTLKQGQQYEFSFYITPSDSCGYYSKKIDVFFGDIDDISKNISCSTPGKIFLIPTFSFDISSFKQTGQEGKWKRLSCTFIAKGTEKSFIVGRFFENKKIRKMVSTRILNYKPSKSFLIENFCSADYYLDYFSLIKK